MKRGKIGPRLLLMTNRKSHMRFRLVPESKTLDDLEGPLHTLFENVRLSNPTTKIRMKIDPNYQRQPTTFLIAHSNKIIIFEFDVSIVIRCTILSFLKNG